VNRGSELEANLPSQASSPAQNNRAEGNDRTENQEGGQHLEATSGSEQTRDEYLTALNGVGRFRADIAPINGQWGGQSNGVGNNPGSRSEETGEHSIGGSRDQGEQSARALTEGGANRVGKDEETEEQPGQTQAIKDENMGGQITGERVGKPEKKGGQLSHERVGENDKQGGQLTQSDLLPSAHPTSCVWVGNAATSGRSSPDDAISCDPPTDGQAANWLKGLLPESQNGWWEVDVKGKGFAVKFRWRDTDRHTLLFPQVTGEQFKALREISTGEVSRVLYERIAASLHSFLLDPAKRDKALIVAQKLGIDLAE